VNKSFVRVRLYYLYLPMDVCTIFLHIFNKKFWLQFICNKLISTTAHESDNNLDKMVYAYLTPDFRKHISRELWYIFVVWSFSVMRFYARCSNTWSPSVRPSVCKISAIRNPPDCNHAIDWLKLYNVLEIHCSCAQLFLDFSLKAGVEGLGGEFCNPQLLNNHSMDWSET
jgi:hypothetical protein